MCTRPVFLSGRAMPVPCGKCLECCTAYNNMWSQRIVDEASLYKENCILTLTYAETDGKLSKRDFQLFMKKLRDRIKPHKIRYYCCGEYGGKGARPHYHCIIFNWIPPDIEYVCKKNGVRYYKSDFVSEVWNKGFISIGEVNIKSAKYCARYLGKLDNREHEVKPFVLMSRRPGIGADIVNPNMLVSGERFFDGKSYQIPKFYLDKLEQRGYNVDILKAVRKNYISRKVGDYYLLEENEKNKRREREVQEKYFR